MNVKKDLISVNFTPNGMRAIKGIVIHSMWGTYSGSIAWFKNPNAKASAHYCISELGEITQCVDESKLDMAWHAGVYDDGMCPQWALPNPNNWCIGIELEDKQNSNWTYPESQRVAFRELVSFLMNLYGIPKENVLLHKNLNPSRRTDPVGEFDFSWVFPSVEKLPKDSIIRDMYTFLCGGFGQDEIDWRMASNKNLIEIGTDICSGDGRFFDKWIKPKIPTVEPTPTIPEPPAHTSDCEVKLASVKTVVNSRWTWISPLSNWKLRLNQLKSLLA